MACMQKMQEHFSANVRAGVDDGDFIPPNENGARGAVAFMMEAWVGIEPAYAALQAAA